MGKSFILLLTLTLAGCSTMSNQPATPNTEGAKRALADESFLINSGNYSRLIEMYKADIKANDSKSTRIKLARAYIDTRDNESALFTLIPVVTSPGAGSEVFYLQGLAQYNIGKVESANRSLAIAAEKAPNDAKVINLLGATQAELGLLKEARVTFNRARSLLYDDQTIKNNLALVDIMEGHYQDAAARLMPIYRADPSAVDEQLKANLAIAAAKLGSFETLRALYGDKYNDGQLLNIFQGLRAATFIPSMSTGSSKDSSLLIKNNTPGNLDRQTNNRLVEQDVLNRKELATEEDNAPKPYPVTQIDKADQPLSTENSASQRGATAPLAESPQARRDEVYEPQAITPQKTNTFESSQSLKKIPDEDSVLVPERTVALPTNFVQSIEFTSVNSAQPIKPVSNQEKRSTFKDLVGIDRDYPDQKKTSKGVSVTDIPVTEPKMTRSIVMLPEYQVTMPSLPIPSISEQPSLQPSSNNNAENLKNASAMGAAVERAQHKTAYEVSDSASDPLPISDGVAVKSVSPTSKTDVKKDWNFVSLEQYSLVLEGGISIPVAQFRHSGDLIDVH